MKVAPKIRHFTCRILRHILPTKRSLILHHITSDDLCPVCSQAAETMDHVFVECAWLNSFWHTVELSSVPTSQTGEDKVSHWIKAMVESHNLDALMIGVVILWLIWGARNGFVFKGVACQGDFLYHKAKAYVAQYLQGQHVSMPQAVIPVVKWCPPSADIFKLNCDGCWKTDGRAGVGAIIRNSDGEVFGAMHKKVNGLMSATEAEALAIKEGLLFAYESGFRRILVESDTSLIIAEINRGVESCSIHGNIIEDIKLLALNFPLCSFTFSPRSCNKVADRLANVGAYYDHDRFWLEETPDCIAAVIIEDA